MNLNQRRVLIVVGVVAGLMLLYPPYRVFGFGPDGRSAVSFGYAFILQLPNAATLDALTLIKEWIIVCAMGGIGFKVMATPKND